MGNGNAAGWHRRVVENRRPGEPDSGPGALRSADGRAVALVVTTGWWGLLPVSAARRLPEIVVIVLTALNVAIRLGTVFPRYYQPFFR